MNGRETVGIPDGDKGVQRVAGGTADFDGLVGCALGWSSALMR